MTELHETERTHDERLDVGLRPGNGRKGRQLLTARELEIRSMARNGFTSREIANYLRLSYQTIERHRNNIQKKINISYKNVEPATLPQKSRTF